VEIDFKRSKSVRELDRLPNFIPETIHSWICAKLLLQLVAVRIASPAVAFPPCGPCIDILPNAGAPLPPTSAASRSRDRGTVVRRQAGLGRRLRRAAARAAS
jgi:hypothetical protein